MGEKTKNTTMSNGPTTESREYILKRSKELGITSSLESEEEQRAKIIKDIEENAARQMDAALAEAFEYRKLDIISEEARKKMRAVFEDKSKRKESW